MATRFFTSRRTSLAEACQVAVLAGVLVLIGAFSMNAAARPSPPIGPASRKRRFVRHLMAECWIRGVMWGRRGRYVRIHKNNK
jgi:hypothetical protein